VKPEHAMQTVFEVALRVAGFELDLFNGDIALQTPSAAC